MRRQRWRAHGSSGRLRAGLGLAAAFLALGSGPALAVNPEQAVGGNGSKWFSGSLLQQPGNNCSILGAPYTETMVSAVAGYGGAPGGGVVRVGDRYYASLLVSIPGNPCGTGSSLVGTDLVLPRGTSVDTSAPIRCFGKPRNSNDFGELTGGNWSFLGSGGPWCPASVGSSLTGTPGAVGVGYRPLANGQLYHLFVPIKSTQTLQGAAASPADEIRWVLSTSGTYSNQGSTYVWTNVFPSGGSGSGPFIYFARDPSVETFWVENPDPPGSENRAEWFANLYSAGLAGTLCWELYSGGTATGSPLLTCNSPEANPPEGGWNGTVAAGPDLWQVTGNGPNGGYVPFSYPHSQTYTIRWKFVYSGGTATNDISFTTLAGPDPDGDGVPNDGTDACPDVSGTEANGCQPAVQTDPDGDGVFGSADKCPDQNGGTSPDGCPPPNDQGNPGTPATGGGGGGATVTPDGAGGGQTGPLPDMDAPTLTAAARKRKLRSVLSKGLPVSFSCSEACTYQARLLLDAKTARRLQVAARRKPVVIARGRKSLAQAGKGKLKIKITRKAAKRLKRARKLRLTLVSVARDEAGNKSAPVRRIVKLKR